jgi:1-acyl-sn-glycerol-3-phosphate acyltransferase
MKAEKRFAIARKLVRFLICPLCPIRFTGTENLPQEGPVILCANHESLLDPIAIGYALRRPVSYMAKKELFKVPLLGSLLRSMCALPVDRGAGDMAAIRASLQALKEGMVFGIFPQGTRSFKQRLPFQSGVSVIALRSGAPVVPVLVGSRARLFRPLRLVFGVPVDLADFAGPTTKEKLEQATRRIEAAVFSLRP